MSWAKHAKKSLGEGETVEIQPRGHSMEPKVKSGAKVTLEPVTRPLKKGDVVLVTCKRRDYLHLIKAVRGGNQYLIGNNKGGTNGWVSAHAVHGIATEIDNG
jgi:hypothetical protein